MGGCASAQPVSQPVRVRRYPKPPSVYEIEKKYSFARTEAGSFDGTSEQLFRSRYKLSSTVLGRGSDAVVYEGVDSLTKQKVALKVVDLDSKNITSSRRQELIQRFRDETNILSSLDHPHVIQLFDSKEELDKLTLVFEYAAGGDLLDHIAKVVRLNERVARRVMMSLVDALKYVHGMHVVHCDLKPDNILIRSELDMGDVIITDFGFASFCVGDTLTRQVGSPNYIAPEVLLGLPYGPAVDVWALGVILYIMLLGCFPFYHSDSDVLFNNIVFGQFSFRNDDISDEAKDLISRILVPDVAQRYTLDQIAQHPWMRLPASNRKASDRSDSYKSGSEHQFDF